MILDFCKHKEKQEYKKAVILNALIEYYKDLKETGLNIPYFLRAKQKYNELIKSSKDVNYYFNKIVERC